MSVKTDRYVTIDDFTPGIYTLPNILTGGGAMIGAPLGSAQEVGTFGCIPGVNGKGLRPAPKQTTKTSTNGAGFNSPGGSTTGFRIIGIICMPGGPGYTPRTWVAFEWNTAAAACIGVADVTTAATPVLEFAQSTVTQADTANRSCVGWARTVMSTVSPYLTAGVATVGFTYQGTNAGAGTAIAGTKLLAAPATPSTPNTNQSLAGGVGYRIFAHQNRLCYLLGYNIANAAAVALQAQVSDGLSFSDPANSNVFPASQNTILDPEGVSGFMAFSPMSASTLLMVKGSQGGVIVQGDIANPIVNRAPAVHGTNGFATDCGPTELGMVYASYYDGLWAWSGGAVAQCISRNIRKSMLQNNVLGGTVASTAVGGGFPGNNVQTRQIGDYLLTSGGWMMHIPSGGWFMIDDTSTRFLGDVDVTPFGVPTGFYTSAANLTGTGAAASFTYGYSYDFLSEATGWSWRSQPIPLSTEKLIDTTEIILTCMGDVGATFVITGYAYNGSATAPEVTAPVTVTLTAPSSTQPVRYRVPFSATGYDVQLKIVAAGTGGGAAPTLGRIDIGVADGPLIGAV